MPLKFCQQSADPAYPLPGKQESSVLWGAVGLDGLAGSSSQQRRVTKKGQSALASVALWIEHQPSNQRVAGLIPSQGTYLSSQGCGPGPQCTVYEKQPCMDVSLPSSLSKNKYNLFKKIKGQSKTQCRLTLRGLEGRKQRWMLGRGPGHPPPSALRPFPGLVEWGRVVVKETA